MLVRRGTWRPCAVLVCAQLLLMVAFVAALPVYADDDEAPFEVISLNMIPESQLRAHEREQAAAANKRATRTLTIPTPQVADTGFVTQFKKDYLALGAAQQEQVQRFQKMGADERQNYLDQQQQIYQRMRRYYGEAGLGGKISEREALLDLLQRWHTAALNLQGATNMNNIIPVAESRVTEPDVPEEDDVGNTGTDVPSTISERRQAVARLAAPQTAPTPDEMQQQALRYRQVMMERQSALMKALQQAEKEDLSEVKRQQILAQLQVITRQLQQASARFPLRVNVNSGE